MPRDNLEQYTSQSVTLEELPCIVGQLRLDCLN